MQACKFCEEQDDCDDCVYNIQKANGTKPPLCDVMAEIKAEKYFDTYGGDSINLLRLEKILSRYFA